MSPILLAIDTTGDYGSIALLRGEELVEELPLHSADGFAHVLFQQVECVMRRAGLSLHDVDCFASASGPGSFTGVRVSLTAVKGLADATGKPAVGVSNLQALACFGTGEVRAPFFDARRGEVYGGLYDASARALGDELVLPFRDWLETLPGGPVELICTDPAPFAAALAGTRFENQPIARAPRSLAAAVGRIAMREFEAGRALDPAALDANYVRRSDAELKWTEA